jgi:hypothetical protein
MNAAATKGGADTESEREQILYDLRAEAVEIGPI